MTFSLKWAASEHSQQNFILPKENCGQNILSFNKFLGMALWGEPPKGALCWGGHNMVNF